MSHTVKMGLPEYSVLSMPELVFRTQCEPGTQILHCFESLFLDSGTPYDIDHSLWVNDLRITLAEIDGLLVGFHRQLCFDYLPDITTELFRTYGIKLLFSYSPRKRDMKDRRVITLGPLTYGYPTSYYNEHCCTEPDENFKDISWSLYSWAQHACNYTGAGNELVTHIGRNIEFHGCNFRKKLRDKLSELGISYDTSITTPTDFLQRCAKSKMAVFAPGASNFALDRAMVMAMSIGCCTIHPETDTIWPGGISLISGVHYLGCKHDFSDIQSLIETPDHIKRQIGCNAKLLFKRHLTPARIIQHIFKSVEKEINHGHTSWIA